MSAFSNGNRIKLHAGQILTLVGSSTASATATTSGGASYSIGNSQTVLIGPYAQDCDISLSVLTGSVTGTIGDDIDSTVSENNAAAHAAMGYMATSPAPTYSANGNLLTATIDGNPYVATEDANGNIETTTYLGVTKTYTWAIQSDGEYHCVGIV